MKILHTADWHIGQFKGPVVDGVNLRSQDLLQITNCSKSDHHIRSRYQMQKINVIITRQGSGK